MPLPASAPVVGVCIPTFEPPAAHLRAALDSVLAQTHARWRLVVHDDGSAGDVRAVVAPYLADPRVELVRAPRRRGIAGNCNAGLARLEEPLVQLLFQDDLWDRTYLERSVAALAAHPAAGFSAAHHAYLGDDGRPAGGFWRALAATKQADVAGGAHDGRAFLRWWTERGLWLNFVGEPSFVLLRREVLERAGGFAAGLPDLLDVDCWIRLLLLGGWVYLPEELGAFRIHDGQATARNRRRGRGALDGFACFLRLVEALPEGEARRHALGTFDRQVEHVLGRVVDAARRGNPIDPRLRSFLAFCAGHPAAALSGLGRYLGAASRRWVGRIAGAAALEP